MKKYAFKEKLQNGEICYGSWITSTDLMICELMRYLDFDWFLIDTEHAFIDIRSLRDMLIVLKHANAAPIVRVNANDKDLIKQALDAGAEGVLIPMVNNKESAEKAVAYCQYPPLGVRGVGPLGASNYVNDLTEYIKTADQRVVILIQIEHIDAVKNLDDILEVAGVDGIFIGPSDLSASMGYLEQPEHQEVQGVIKEIIKKCVAKNIPVGFPCGGDPLDIKKRLENDLKGVQFVIAASDIGFIFAGGRETISKLKGGEK